MCRSILQSRYEVSDIHSGACDESTMRLAFRVPFQGDEVRFGEAYVTRKVRAYAMAAKAGVDLEAFGKAKSGSGSPSKERGDCEFF